MKQKTETPFQQLFESVPGLYLILSPQLHIVAVNDAYLRATMTRKEEIMQRHLFDVFPDNPDDPGATGVSNLRASLEYVLKNHVAHTMAVQQYDIRRPDGSFETRFWSPLNKPVLNEEKELVYIIHRVEDVTEFMKIKAEREREKQLTLDLRRQLEEAEMEVYQRAQEIQLINSSLQSRVEQQTLEITGIFERITDSFLALDKEGRVTYLNRKAAEAIGIEMEEGIGKSLTEIYPPKIWGDSIEKACANAFTNQAHVPVEVNIKSRNRWFEIDIYPSLSGCSLFFRDISERKITEEQLQQSHEQLRLLASHLQNIREEEQRRIAREVHDELGQQLTALKMDVSWIKKKITDMGEKELFQRLTEMTGLLDATVQTVRKIASELRPAILDDFGIITALEWQSEEFTKRFDIPVTFQSAVDHLDVSPGLAIGLFRTYQESLTNIARHSAASQVVSSLRMVDHQIILLVTDDGKGFDTNSAKLKKSLGLLGMKERVLMMDGKLEIKSLPGKGTSVLIAVPLKV